MLIQIKHRYTGKVLYETEAEDQQAAVEKAVKEKKDLSFAYIEGDSFIRAKLSGAKLAHADLAWVGLYKADLSNADLSYSNLRFTNLSNADLSNANLKAANIDGTHLEGAALSNANLSWTFAPSKYKAKTKQGWKYESSRHALAAKGIKTGTKR